MQAARAHLDALKADQDPDTINAAIRDTFASSSEAQTDRGITAGLPGDFETREPEEGL
jgi:hypothetical protein